MWLKKNSTLDDCKKKINSETLPNLEQNWNDEFRYTMQMNMETMVWNDVTCWLSWVLLCWLLMWPLCQLVIVWSNHCCYAPKFLWNFPELISFSRRNTELLRQNVTKNETHEWLPAQKLAWFLGHVPFIPTGLGPVEISNWQSVYQSGWLMQLCKLDSI